MSPMLLDTDTLSEVMKGQNLNVNHHAEMYLSTYGEFTFSIITRYEILRGLEAKRAFMKIKVFEERCRESLVLPLSDEIIAQAAEIYGELYRRGELISDADILIAATAKINSLVLVAGNQAHFQCISGLSLANWRVA
jgi:tRNA(fMet)-specific endonuclease VapC